jgi:hypothetical protein
MPPQTLPASRRGGGDDGCPAGTGRRRRHRAEARQQKVRRKMQHPIYFSNIQIKHLQHTSENK